MAEYYTVLKRAVGGLDPNVADARRAVYDKARNALIGQLKAVEPPLTTAEISRQRLELEEAIRRVERETAAGVVGAAVAPPPGRAAPPPPPPPPPPPVDRYAAAPDPASEPSPSPQDVFRRAMQEAGMRGSEAGAASARMERLPVRARDADMPRSRPAPEPPAYRADTAYRAPEPVYQPEPDYPPEPAEYRREPDYGRPPAYEPPRDYAGGRNEPPPPRLAPDYGQQDWDRGGGAAAGPSVDRRDRPAGVKTKTRRRGYLEEERNELEEAPRRSRLPTIFLFVLILGMLGGLGALAWSQRAVITDLLASFDAGGTGETPAAPPAAADAASTKNADRLLEDDAPAPPAPANVRVVNPEDPPGDGTTPVAALDDSADRVPTADAPAIPADAAASATPADDALVAQKAILYEEPLTGAANGVTAINAAVTWRYVEDGPNGPEIEASLDVPERGMKIRFSLHRNTDDTLPASHLVEVVVDTPPDFPGKAVASVPRIVLKPTEESRGQPLVGAAAKVADGFFWIALSANQADVAANLQLIKERNWIDLPLVYDNGQRAILTFEKGTPGGRVLERALAAWGNGQSG